MLRVSLELARAEHSRGACWADHRCLRRKNGRLECLPAVPSSPHDRRTSCAICLAWRCWAASPSEFALCWRTISYCCATGAVCWGCCCCGMEGECGCGSSPCGKLASGESGIVKSGSKKPPMLRTPGSSFRNCCTPCSSTKKNCTNAASRCSALPMVSDSERRAVPGPSQYQDSFGRPPCHRQRKPQSMPRAPSGTLMPHPTRPSTQPRKCKPHVAT